MAYDIIGDIHGQADKLEALLRTLGYRDTAGAWRHQERQAIFVGDFLDRGPAQVRSIDIARRMVDAGAALAVMGNHELNAIAWHTPDPRHPGDFLRSHFSAEMGREEPEAARRLPGRSGGQTGAACRDHRLVLDPPALAGVARPAGGACVLACAVHGLAGAAAAMRGISHERIDGPGNRRAEE